MKLFDSMKPSKYITLLLVTAISASCSMENKGAGDATIGFSASEYIYKESAGLVKLPVKFTGEPESWPIEFDVEVTLTGGGNPEEVIHMTQSSDLKYMGDPLAPAYIEFSVIDNKVINENVSMTFTLTGITGATPVNATTKVIIADNDNNPYDRLWGDWILSGIDEDEKENTFEINISGGFTEEERKENEYNTLVCWGWAGQQYDLSDSGIEPARQPVWYIRYDEQTETLSVRTNTLMGSGWKFSGIDNELCDLYMLTVLPGWSLDETSELKGAWSEDMNTITFEGGYGLAARVKGADTGTTYGYWYGFTDITLTRK